MKTFGIIMLLLFPFGLMAQKTMRYEGAYPNRRNEQATATYTYYKDTKSGKQVKHGSFRYNVKIKGTQNRLYRNITGEYKNGWKDGLWTFSVSSKDYNLKNDGWFYSLSIQMEANYSDGWPDGTWTYSAFVKKRKSAYKNGQKKWQAYQTVEDVKIKLNFDKGLLIDSLWIRNPQGTSIFALMDNHGFLKNDFLIVAGEKEIKKHFRDGFMIDDRNDASKAVYDYYVKYRSNLAAAGARLDTVSLFSQKMCIISATLNKQIFNDDYFNYLYIDGDRMLSFKGSRKTMAVNYRGLLSRQLNVFISKDEQAKIQAVYNTSIDVKRQLETCERAYKKSNNDVGLNTKRSQLQAISNRLKAYTCQLKIYKSTLPPAIIAQKSAACNSNIQVDETQSRLALLNRIYNQSKQLKKQAQGIKCAQ
jgi:hypothetical protein